eukprot:NODE_45_length_27728_cov_0.328387.p9 type:complete len:240 gc:universal NODE_45_length_27728_cov_0.328387:7858-7139(-)
MSPFHKEANTHKTENPFRSNRDDPIQDNCDFKELKKQYEAQKFKAELFRDNFEKKRKEKERLERQLRDRDNTPSNRFMFLDCKPFMKEFHDLLTAVAPINKKTKKFDAQCLKLSKSRVEKVKRYLTTLKDEKIKSKRELKQQLQKLELEKKELVEEIRNLRYNCTDMEQRNLERETKKEELMQIKSKLVQVLNLMDIPCTMDSVYDKMREICANMTSTVYSEARLNTCKRSKQLFSKLS